jgi:hypothetical protein
MMAMVERIGLSEIEFVPELSGSFKVKGSRSALCMEVV